MGWYPANDELTVSLQQQQLRHQRRQKPRQRSSLLTPKIPTIFFRFRKQWWWYCDYVDGDVVAMKTFFMAGAVRAAIFCPTTVEPVNETMRTWWWLDLPLTRGRGWASLGDAEDGEDLLLGMVSFFVHWGCQWWQLRFAAVEDDRVVMNFGVKPLGEWQWPHQQCCRNQTPCSPPLSLIEFSKHWKSCL